MVAPPTAVSEHTSSGRVVQAWWAVMFLQGSAQTRGDPGHSMLGERIASQSEVIRAIASGHSPCLVGCPHLDTQLMQTSSGDGSASPLE